MYLITGATGGIGRATIFALAELGERVVATGRSARRLLQLQRDASARGLSVSVVQLDVTDQASIDAARQEVLALDPAGPRVLIHAAGMAELGPLMLVTDAALKRHFDTNAFGPMAVTRAFLPSMKARGNGRVVHVGSLVDRFTLATHGAYGASVHALRAINDSLRQELARFHIDVVLVEPGTVRTAFIRDAFGGLDAKRWSGSRWNPVLDRLERLEESIERMGVDPERVARTLVRAASRKRPRRRYVIANASATAQMTAARVLPTRAFDGLVRRTLGIAPRQPAPTERTVYRERPIALVTGAGGGIGAASSLRLARSGYRVIATDINEEALTRLEGNATAESLRIDTLRLDVTDVESVSQAVRDVRERTEGAGVDLLVNNAGYAELGPLDEVETETFQRQFHVNVYGLMNVTRAFAGQMCDQRCGRIINISSIAGVVAFPFMGVYHASKFAVEALSDALRQELGPFGVDVIVVQPSFIATGFADRALQSLDEVPPQDWAPVYAHVDEIIGRMEKVGGTAHDVAEVVHAAARSPRPEPRYRAPRSAEIAAQVLPWIPAAVSDRIFARAFFPPGGFP
ncbi:MAG: SDR family NAD(P)-dependent oxidoreductase [Myxococcota bacterium]